MLPHLCCRYPKLDGQNLEFVGGDGPRESDPDAGGAGNTKSVAKSVGMAMLQSLAFSAAGGASSRAVRSVRVSLMGCFVDLMAG